MRPLRIALIGYGKIASEEHRPAIGGEHRFSLAASVNRSGIGPAPCYKGYREMLDAGHKLDAVAITTPPTPRYAIARDCIEAGLHCLLEKPPTATMSEIEDLACLARNKPVTLFTAWHARYHPAIQAAARALADKHIAAMEIVWREDVRKWHPGQQWIWAPGGFGVFDPGINALSIATAIFPGALFVAEAELFFPANRQAPIAAAIHFSSPVAEGALTCALDWRHQAKEAWTIDIRTTDGVAVTLSEGGSKLAIDGKVRVGDGAGEYPALYRAFADLIVAGQSHVDATPLRLVADAFLVGRRTMVEAFTD